MTRNARALLVVGIAVLTAAAASYGVYLAIIGRPVPPPPTVFVVVAAKPLDIGAYVTAEDLRVVPWPEGNPVVGAFSEVSKVENRGLIVPVAENEPVTETKLAPVGAGAGLTPAIRVGMRAMSVRVNDVIGVAGFVVPGTKVDVLVTIQGQNEGASRIVVSNVQVLTAGTRYDEDKAKTEGKPIPSAVVTLLVSPEDAERIALASTEGQIMLALRNPLDTAETKTNGIRTSALMLMGNPQPQPAARPTRPGGAPSAPRRVVETPPPAPPAPPPPQLVETIKAGKREQEALR